MDDHRFALCLTHDVDRPYKRLHQALYSAARERSPAHLRRWLTGNPYWQFDSLMDLEEDLGVRSAFYFLFEPSLWNLPVRTMCWRRLVEHLGRYDPSNPELVSVIERLEEGGWEVGIHGSLRAATDPERLAVEVDRLASILDGPVRGGRQHHLRLSVPDTWRGQAEAGLCYDGSLGSPERYGFEFGTRPFLPVSDGPLVFPLTLMETSLPDPGERFPAAWSACERLLREAADRRAVATVLFHQRYFHEGEFPGYRRLYRRLVERADEMGAWVGPPGDLCAELGPIDR